MKKVYLLFYWSEKDQRTYLAAAFQNRENAKQRCKDMNEYWEARGYTYHIETMTISDQ